MLTKWGKTLRVNTNAGKPNRAVFAAKITITGSRIQSRRWGGEFNHCSDITAMTTSLEFVTRHETSLNSHFAELMIFNDGNFI